MTRAGPLTLGLALLMTGCAGWKSTMVKPTVSQSREERAKEAVREFEERRDTAQLEAALDRFKYRDVATAEAMLTALANRRPEFLEARMRLAEILWTRGEPAAETHLRAVLAAQPNRAEAHHALGLLLDGTGRAEEARQHLAKAAELEPENEIYRSTRDTIAGR